MTTLAEATKTEGNDPISTGLSHTPHLSHSSPSSPTKSASVGQKSNSTTECLVPSPTVSPNEENFVILKSSLVSPNEQEFEQLTAWLAAKLTAGGGETMLDVGTGADDSVSGLSPEDYEASVASLQVLAEAQNADCVLLRERSGGGTKARPHVMGQYLVRKKADITDFMEVRVAVVGNVDAGKSTLLGVLTHGELDNGRGHARMKLFRHKHEMESGRTSSVGNDILGFDSTGKVVNKPDHGHLDWVKICRDSSKVITFIDLAGHERYLKTTVFGMTGHLPDFTMLMVGANAGIVGMTKEHLGLALALNVPVMVVVTKIDMCPPNVMQDTLRLLHKILKSAGCRKVPLLVRSEDDVVVAATNFVSERLCPIFQVSNVEGTNLHLLTMFLNLLSIPRTCQDDSQPPHFQIDDTYQVPGVGVVVSGTCIKGVIRVNDTLLLGPTGMGEFVPMPIKSIHRKRMPVREVRGGQTASFALKKIKISEVRKGQVLIDASLNPASCWEFKGEILVLHHPTTISTKYQAMVHVGPVRQTASIMAMDRDCLRTGDKAHVHFRFIKHPEYLQPGLKMVFREGRTKAVGKVLEVIPKAAPAHQQHRNHKINKMLKQSAAAAAAAAAAAHTPVSPGDPSVGALPVTAPSSCCTRSPGATSTTSPLDAVAYDPSSTTIHSINALSSGTVTPVISPRLASTSSSEHPSKISQRQPPSPSSCSSVPERQQDSAQYIPSLTPTTDQPQFSPPNCPTEQCKTSPVTSSSALLPSDVLVPSTTIITQFPATANTIVAPDAPGSSTLVTVPPAATAVPDRAPKTAASSSYVQKKQRNRRGGKHRCRSSNESSEDAGGRLPHTRAQQDTPGGLALKATWPEGLS
ncbi:Transcription factor GTP-binding domain [Trinorchestia longiramus]|nr:Transcription factor GTP-binding domain [Trinorchestia longiramus]